VSEDSETQTEQVIQVPLTLVLPVKPGQTEALKAALLQLAKPEQNQELEDALNRVGTVHSTRFVVLEDDQGKWAKLLVIALYDGTVHDYIAAFARELNKQFNLLFGFIEDTPDKPSIPVNKDVDRFVAYVENRDVKPTNGQTYRAYPGLTALDIYEATRPRHDGAPTR
jgi:hypothetical protein